jgi:hypothetical protein
MTLHRRSFLATLFAPLVAKFAPKPNLTHDYGSPIGFDEVGFSPLPHYVSTGIKHGDTITIRMPEYLKKGKGTLFNPHENIAARLPEIHAQTLTSLKFFANNRTTQV